MSRATFVSDACRFSFLAIMVFYICYFFLKEAPHWSRLVERRYDLEHGQEIRAYDDSKMTFFSHDPWMDATKLALHQGRPVVVATNRSDVAFSDF